MKAENELLWLKIYIGHSVIIREDNHTKFNDD